MKTVCITCSFNVPDDLFVAPDTMKKEAYGAIEKNITRLMGNFSALKYTSSLEARGTVTNYHEDTVTDEELLALHYNPDTLPKERLNELKKLEELVDSGKAELTQDAILFKRYVRWKETSVLKCESAVR